MRGSRGVGALLAVGIVVGVGVTASAQLPRTIVPIRTTINCPSIGHGPNLPPYGGGGGTWLTSYTSYPNTMVTAEISGGNFVCHEIVNPVIPLAPLVSRSTYGLDTGISCTANAPGAPPVFTCNNGLQMRCPNTAVTDTADDGAWTTTHHSGGTPLLAVQNAVLQSLTCIYLTAPAFVGPNGSEVATSTRPVGSLVGCQVNSDGKSFSCLMTHLPPPVPTTAPSPSPSGS